MPVSNFILPWNAVHCPQPLDTSRRSPDGILHGFSHHPLIPILSFVIGEILSSLALEPPLLSPSCNMNRVSTHKGITSGCGVNHLVDPGSGHLISEPVGSVDWPRGVSIHIGSTI